MGNEIKFKCKNCDTENRIHINRIFATNSNLPVLVCGLVGFAIIVWGLMTEYKNGISIVWTTGIGATVISAGLFSNLGSTARAFNKTMI